MSKFFSAWWLVLACLGLAEARSSVVFQQMYFSVDGKRVLVTHRLENERALEVDQVLKVLSFSGVEWQVLVEGRDKQLSGDAALNFTLARFLSEFTRRYELQPKAAVPLFQAAGRPPQMMGASGPQVGGFSRHTLRVAGQDVSLKLNVVRNAHAEPCSLLTDTGGVAATFELALDAGQGQKVIYRHPGTEPCVYAYALRRVDVQGSSMLLSLVGFAPNVEGDEEVAVYVFLKK